MCVQIAGLLASLVVLLVVVAIGFVFQPLPQVGETVELMIQSFLSGSSLSQAAAADILLPSQSVEQTMADRIQVKSFSVSSHVLSSSVLVLRLHWLPSSWSTCWGCSNSSETFLLCGGPVRLNWSVCHIKLIIKMLLPRQQLPKKHFGQVTDMAEHRPPRSKNRMKFFLFNLFKPSLCCTWMVLSAQYVKQSLLMKQDKFQKESWLYRQSNLI